LTIANKKLFAIKIKKMKIKKIKIIFRINIVLFKTINNPNISIIMHLKKINK